MSKVGILTFHYADNCGAQLQLISLYSYLEELGYAPEVIDYRSKRLLRRNAIIQNPFYRAQAGWYAMDTLTRKFRRACSEALFALKTNLKVPQVLKVHRTYEQYKKLNPLRISERINSIDELERLSQSYSRIFVGSDQIWNIELYNGVIDSVYFLQSSNIKCKKIGYAVSAGNELRVNPYQIKDLIDRFDYFSAREQQLADQIKEATGETVPVVLDPVFLHTRDYWCDYCTKSENGNYIFLYVLEDNKELLNIVERIKSIYGSDMDVVEVGYKKLYAESILVNQLDPGVFLGLIKDARFIVTNSFHATAFSVIFEKEFYTLRHSTRNNRMESLLTKVHLMDRCISRADEVRVNRINYEVVNEYLEKEIRYSKSYLQCSCKGDMLNGNV